MSLVKRGKTWHTHFFVDGQRFRQSLETSDWREAQAKEKELIAQAPKAKPDQLPIRALQSFLSTQAAKATSMAENLELSESSQKKERQLL